MEVGLGSLLIGISHFFLRLKEKVSKRLVSMKYASRHEREVVFPTLSLLVQIRLSAGNP